MSSRFNTYHWVTFKVTKRDQVPSIPHFQALVFGNRRECSPSYGPPDPPGDTYYDVPNVDVYAFKKREELDLFVSEIARSEEQFVFYAVPALGQATVKVEVGVEIK